MLLLFVTLALASTPADVGDWAHSLERPAAGAAASAEGYRFAGAAFAELAELAAARPGVVEIERLGTTDSGHPIWAFHVQEPGDETVGSSLVFGGIHALEWISVEVAVELLVEVIHRPVPGQRVTVIPLLNLSLIHI